MLGPEENALDVDVHHGVPVRFFQQRDGQDLRDAGVVDEHIDPAPGGSQLSDGCLHMCCIRH